MGCFWIGGSALLCCCVAVGGRRRRRSRACPNSGGAENLPSGFHSVKGDFCEIIRDDGDVDAALAGAVTRLDAVYEVPFLYHATLEPMNCGADVREDTCEIWAPTQVPGMCLALAAAVTGLPRESVTVHMLRTGGGFGRRLMADYAATGR